MLYLVSITVFIVKRRTFFLKNQKILQIKIPPTGVKNIPNNYLLLDDYCSTLLSFQTLIQSNSLSFNVHVILTAIILSPLI